MVECNSTERSNRYTNLNDQQQVRLNKINEIRDNFVAEIKETELGKYIASFNYFDKSLIVLSATSGVISIVLFSTVIVAPVGVDVQVLVLHFKFPQEL